MPTVSVPPPGWEVIDSGEVPIVPEPPEGWPPEEDDGNVPIVPDDPWDSVEDVDYGEVPIVPPPDGWDSGEDFNPPPGGPSPFDGFIDGNDGNNNNQAKPDWWFW